MLRLCPFFRLLIKGSSQSAVKGAEPRGVIKRHRISLSALPGRWKTPSRFHSQRSRHTITFPSAAKRPRHPVPQSGTSLSPRGRALLHFPISRVTPVPPCWRVHYRRPGLLPFCGTGITSKCAAGAPFLCSTICEILRVLRRISAIVVWPRMAGIADFRLPIADC